jgi:hypothetical protein
VTQCAAEKFAKKLLGESEIETVLQRLDRLTQDEARVTVVQTLGVVHGLMGNMKVVMEGAQLLYDRSQIFGWPLLSLDGKVSTDSIREDLGVYLAQRRSHARWLRVVVSIHQTLNKINKTQRLLIPFPHDDFVVVTDGIFVGDRLQKDVQHWLSPPNPSTNQNFVRKGRHTGTAAWFFESSALTEWKAKGSLLWIHGKRTSSELSMSPFL